MVECIIRSASEIVLHPQTQPDRRGAQRVRTVYRMVQIEHEGDEGLACCRNISDSGMKLELSMAVWAGGAITVAFSPTISITGRIIWAQGRECGVAFTRRIDAATVLRESAMRTRDETCGGLRLKRKLPAKVRVDGEARDMVINGLSQNAMRVTLRGDFRPGLHVSVMLGNGREKRESQS